MGAQPGRPLAFEVGRGQIVERHVDLEGQQIAQAEVEFPFDLGLAGLELVEGAVPPLELAQRPPHAGQPTAATLLVRPPAGHPARPRPVTHNVRLQPARQAVLARGGA